MYEKRIAVFVFISLWAFRSLMGGVSDRPNIIFFLTDDQRDDVLGCYGNPIVNTPTIDRLAAEGVRFENSFCEVPICTASRAAIFTGLSQRTHGFNFGERPVEAKYIATSYPMVLKDAGYRVGFAGKFGVKFANSSLEKGFDFIRKIGRTPYLHKMSDGSQRHETDLCADAAIEFIQSTPSDQPFCMSVSFNASHAEDRDHRPGYHFQWPESVDGMYESIEVPAPQLADEAYFNALPEFLSASNNLSRERFFWRWDTPQKYQANIRAYYRMATGIDNAIARVLSELERQGLSENTVIVYSADNGLMLGDRGAAGKWNHYEQSLRVPLIVYNPALPSPLRGLTIKQVVSNLSLAPTFVDIAGLTPPEVYQGKSLLPLIQEDSDAAWPSEIYMEHQFDRYNNWHGIRGERFKYVVYYQEEGGPVEILHDLKKDPNELLNLAVNPEYEQQLSQMRLQLESYLRAYPDRNGVSKTALGAELLATQLKPASDKSISFTGKYYKKMGNAPVLTLENQVTWRLEVNIDSSCDPRAVLMGNRKSSNGEDTFFKITPSRGVQLYHEGQRLFKMDAKLPRNRWALVEVKKEGERFTLFVDGKQTNSVLVNDLEQLPSMPCYLGGDPSVSEFAVCSIRNATIE
ncbi:sulfatase-like hydrolase/transferase [Coraliomargarita sp. W4R72]